MAPVTLPPGFRFHPTDEELVAYYLERKVTGRPIELEIIPDVDIYKCEPWDLPDKSFLPSKDMEWYFFSQRDRKYPNGSRTNRATKAGYWKATGKDRLVRSQKTLVGMKKTLVYYRGRAPHGIRSNWVMHEYRLIDSHSALKDGYALCRVFKKISCRAKGEERQSGGAGEGDHETLICNGSPVQCREGEEENEEEEDSRFPSDTCSSEVTEGSHVDNGVFYRQPWGISSVNEGDSSTNASPMRGGSIYNITKEEIRRMSEYTSIELPYPPLAVEDFPPMETIATARLISKPDQTSDDYLLLDKFRDYLTEANVLEDFFSFASSDSQDNSINPPTLQASTSSTHANNYSTLLLNGSSNLHE